MYKNILLAVDGSEHIINICPEKTIKIFPNNCYTYI